MYHLDLDHVQEFIVLADNMSFVRAAERLFISQSTLSRHISALEVQLGVQLIERNTRTVYLTEAGIALYREFVKLMESVRNICKSAAEYSSSHTGRLRISVPAWSMAHLDKRILLFCRLYPEIRLELNFCDPFVGQEQLQKGETDICVAMHTSSLSDQWEWVKLADERLCAVMSRENPLAARESVSFQDLKEEKFLLLEAEDGADADHAGQKSLLSAGRTSAGGTFRKSSGLKQLLAGHGIPASRFLYLDNHDMLPLVIWQKDAVCLLMQSIGSMGKDYLVSVPVSDEDAVFPLYLCRRRSRAGDTAEAFFEIISGECPEEL